MRQFSYPTQLHVEQVINEELIKSMHLAKPILFAAMLRKKKPMTPVIGHDGLRAG